MSYALVACLAMQIAAAPPAADSSAVEQISAKFDSFDLSNPRELRKAHVATMYALRKYEKDDRALGRIAFNMEKLFAAWQTTEHVPDATREKMREILKERLDPLNEQLGRKPLVAESPAEGEQPMGQFPSVQTPGQAAQGAPNVQGLPPQLFQQGQFWQAQGKAPGGFWKAFGFGMNMGAIPGQAPKTPMSPGDDANPPKAGQGQPGLQGGALFGGAGGGAMTEDQMKAMLAQMKASWAQGKKQGFVPADAKFPIPDDVTPEQFQQIMMQMHQQMMQGKPPVNIPAPPQP